MGRFTEGLRAGLSLGDSIMKGRDQAAQRDILSKANEAARKAYDDHRAQFEQANQPQTSERLRLDQADPTAAGMAPDLGGASLGLGPSADFQPDSAGLGARSGLTLGAADKPIPRETTTTPAAKWDEREGILAGMQARRRALMDGGADPEAWMGDWGKEANLRAAIRGERVGQAEQMFKATGDFGAYAKAIYPLIDDGLDIVDAKPQKTLEGGEGWSLVVKGEDGQERTQFIGQQEAMELMQQVRDPEAVKKYEAQKLIERLKANEGIRQKQGEQEAVRETNKDKHRLTLGEIAARGKEDRRTDGARAGIERNKPITLGEGQILVAPGKGGKFEQKAEGKPKTLGSTAQPSAGNRILDLRKEAAQAIAQGRDPEKVRARFRERTGEDL